MVEQVFEDAQQADDEQGSTAFLPGDHGPSESISALVNQGETIGTKHQQATEKPASVQAKPFVGKNVKVTGTLDTATNTIHVATIEPPSS